MPTAHDDQSGLGHDVSGADDAVNALADRFAAVLGPFLKPGEPFALLDFPDHDNIGDNAIYAGELAFLDAHVGRPASYVCSHKTYRADVKVFCPEGPILLHGGGNFGDVWPSFQAFRFEVLERYRGRHVIQLPQSIHFDDPSAISEAARHIDAHGQFTLLVRDEPSRDLAQKHFDCEVLLCPDAAYALRRLPAVPGTLPVLSLLRRDKETVGQDRLEFLHDLGPVVDWGWPNWSRWRKGWFGRLTESALGPHLPRSEHLMRAREKIFRRKATDLVSNGVTILQLGQVVVSDRLHAHILSSLMRRPHVMLDNSYGKIARYIACWGNDGLARRATGPDDLRRILAEFADPVQTVSSLKEDRR